MKFGKENAHKVKESTVFLNILISKCTTLVNRVLSCPYKNDIIQDEE